MNLLVGALYCCSFGLLLAKVVVGSLLIGAGPHGFVSCIFCQILLVKNY